MVIFYGKFQKNQGFWKFYNIWFPYFSTTTKYCKLLNKKFSKFFQKSFQKEGIYIAFKKNAYKKEQSANQPDK